VIFFLTFYGYCLTCFPRNSDLLQFASRFTIHRSGYCRHFCKIYHHYTLS